MKKYGILERPWIDNYFIKIASQLFYFKEYINVITTKKLSFAHNNWKTIRKIKQGFLADQVKLNLSEIFYS